MLKRGLLALAAAGGLLLGGCSLLGEAAVDGSQIEERVSDTLAEQFGEAPADVSCPDDLPADMSASVQCTVTASDGTEFGVTVTVTGVDGNSVNMEIQPDDAETEPTPS